MNWNWFVFVIKFGKIMHRKRLMIRATTILLVIVYYSYLRSRFLHTNNWESDVGYCFAEVGKCMTDSTLHGIVRYAAEDEPNSKVLPVCYNTAGVHHDQNICYSNLVSLSCTGAEWNAHDTLDLESLFGRTHSKQNYISYDVAILILSIIVFVLYNLFSSKNSNFVDQSEGSFSSVSDSRKMIVLGNVLMIVQVALMIASSQSFALMRVVSCGLGGKSTSTGIMNSFSSSGGDDSDLCNTCNSNIRSIVFAHDLLVSSYPTLSMLLAVAVLCCAIYAMCYANTDEEEVEEWHANSLDTESGSESRMERETFWYLARTLSGNMAARRYTATDRVRTPAEEFHVHATFKKRNEGRMRLWKFGYKDCGIDPAAVEDECAVCLEPLAGRLQGSSSSNRSGDHSGWKIFSDISRKGGVRASRTRTRVVPFEVGIPPERETAAAHTDVESPSGLNASHQTTASPNELAPVKVPCGHCFHESCICGWMRAHQTCPICRADLETGTMGNN